MTTQSARHPAPPAPIPTPANVPSTRHSSGGRDRPAPYTPRPASSGASSSLRSSRKKPKVDLGPEYDRRWYSSPLEDQTISSGSDFTLMRQAYDATSAIMNRVRSDRHKLMTVLKQNGYLESEDEDEDEDEKEEVNLFANLDGAHDEEVSVKREHAEGEEIEDEVA